MASDDFNKDEAKPSQIPILETEISDTGTLIYQGFLVGQDYNPDLTGRHRIDIYDQMRLGDGTIRMGLMAVKYPILSANWFIDGDREDLNEFAESQLTKNPLFSFDSLLRNMLTMCDYGNALFEKVYYEMPDGKIGWKKFGHRLSKTIYRWTLSDGVTPGITQILPSLGGSREIPAWKLMYCILDMEGSNYEGQSLLRAAYKHWYYKDLYYKIDSIAAEKQGLGIPILHVPASTTPTDLAKAREIVKNMRVNEQAYAELPPGYDITFMDMKALQIKNTENMTAHHDRSMAKAFLTQFQDIGAKGSGGAYSASQDQSALFYLGLTHIARTCRDALNMEIRELINLNFGPQKEGDYPYLDFTKISNNNLMLFATALANMAQQGVIIPDDETEEHIRDMYDLPEKQVGFDRATIQKQKQQQQTAELKIKSQTQPVVNSEPRQFIEDIKELRDEIRETIHATT